MDLMELLSTSICVLDLVDLKVIKSRKQFMVPSILPKMKLTILSIIFEVHFFVFREIFLENSVLVYGWYSRAGYDGAYGIQNSNRHTPSFQYANIHSPRYFGSVWHYDNLPFLPLFAPAASLWLPLLFIYQWVKNPKVHHDHGRSRFCRVLLLLLV